MEASGFRVARNRDAARQVGQAACPTWNGHPALQLRHAHALPAAHHRTGAAMASAVQAGLLPDRDADALMTAWELAARIRNAIVLVGAGPRIPCPPGTPS